MIFIVLLAAATAATTAAAAGEDRRVPPVPTLRELECNVCNLLVREVQGVLAENYTLGEVEAYIRTRVCAKLASHVAETVCDAVVEALPLVVKLVDRYDAARVCVQLHACDSVLPPAPGVDGEPLPVYRIDLDAPAERRWAVAANTTVYWSNLWLMHNTLDALLTERVSDTLYALADDVLAAGTPDFRGEVRGIADVTGLPAGFIVLLQVFHEITDACTSVVAQPAAADGRPIWMRNQDLPGGMGFTRLLRAQAVHVQFTRGAAVAFEGVTFVGFTGLPTGSLRGSFSVSINARPHRYALLDYIEQVLRELAAGDVNTPCWLMRDALAAGDSFDAAVARFRAAPLPVPIYYIVAGPKRNQGVIVARNRTGTAWVRRLGTAAGTPSGPGYFQVITNYDLPTQGPMLDRERFMTALHVLPELCGGGADVGIDCLYKMLSTKPILNLQSLYTAYAIPAQNMTMVAKRRVCHKDNGVPCIE